MKIAIGSDHRGFEVKNKVSSFLKKEQYEVLDCGTHSADSCDYPNIALEVGKMVGGGQVDCGILICMSGIGMAIVANKVKGVRAGLCHNLKSATLSRQHNDANVLVLAAGEIKSEIDDIVKTWITTEFEGGRHQRRVDQISTIETNLHEGQKWNS